MILSLFCWMMDSNAAPDDIFLSPTICDYTPEEKNKNRKPRDEHAKLSKTEHDVGGCAKKTCNKKTEGADPFNYIFFDDSGLPPLKPAVGPVTPRPERRGNKLVQKRSVAPGEWTPKLKNAKRSKMIRVYAQQSI